jgi:hypothetical protein
LFQIKGNFVEAEVWISQVEFLMFKTMYINRDSQ